MAYNQGVGGGYPHSQQTTTTPGMQYPTGGTGMHSTAMDSGYVQPPQNISQAPGTGTMGTTGTMGGAGPMGGAGTMGGTGPMIGTGHLGVAGPMGTAGQMGGAAPMGGTGAMGGMGGAGSAVGGIQQSPVIGQQYVAQTVRSYAVSKKVMSVSKGDWTITNQAGLSSFRVDGRVASMRDRRFLRDNAGNKILTMKKKLITMHDTWEIFAGDSSTVLATCKKSSLVQFRTSMDVNVASSTTGKQFPDYLVKGDFFDRNVTIFHGEEPAALVTRQITFKAAILDKDTFGVTIFPGVDEALVFALIVIMDEVFLHSNDD